MFGVLRTWLALWVVTFHLLEMPLIGPYAVFGFYSLSGFLMTAVLHERYGYTAGGRIRYVVNHALRLYPGYWASVGLSLVLLWWIGPGWLREYHPAIARPETPWQVAQNATMLFVAPFPNTVSPRLSPPAWALTVEIFFYLLIAAGISRTERRTRIWIGCSLAYMVLTYVFGLGPHYRYVPVTAASLPFAVGSLMYFRKERLRRFLERSDLLRPWLWMTLLTVNAVACATAQSRLVSEVGLFATVVLAALLVVVLFCEPLPFVSKELDAAIGRLSYPVYLAHWQMGAVACYLRHGTPVFGLGQEALTSFALAVLFVLVYAVGAAALIDRPLDRLRGRLGQRARTTRAGLAPHYQVP